MRNGRVSRGGAGGRRSSIGRLEGAADAVAGRILQRLERHDAVAAGAPRLARHQLPARVGDVQRDVAVDLLAAGRRDADGAQRDGVIERHRRAQHDRLARAGDGQRDLPRVEVERRRRRRPGGEAMLERLDQRRALRVEPRRRNRQAVAAAGDERPSHPLVRQDPHLHAPGIEEQRVAREVVVPEAAVDRQEGVRDGAGCARRSA